jgi:hypothetical protein
MRVGIVPIRSYGHLEMDSAAPMVPIRVTTIPCRGIYTVRLTVNSGGAPTISASVEKNIHVAEKEDPKILVHLTSPTTKNSCSFGALSDSRSAKVNGNLSGPAGPYYFLYILASPGVSFPIASMGGVQFGRQLSGPGHVRSDSRGNRRL